MKKSKKKTMGLVLDIDVTAKISASQLIYAMLKKITAKELLKRICVCLSYDAATTMFSPMSNLLKGEKNLKKDVEDAEAFAIIMHTIKNWDRTKKFAIKCMGETFEKAKTSA